MQTRGNVPDKQLGPFCSIFTKIFQIFRRWSRTVEEDKKMAFCWFEWSLWIIIGSPTI